MPLPTWIVAIHDPAYAYMLRSRGVRRHRAPFLRRRASQLPTGYAPIGVAIAPLTPEARQALRDHAETENVAFVASIREVERRYGEILRTTADALLSAGTATLRTSSGNIEARIIRFRKDAVVLEIHFPRGRIQCRSSLRSVGDQAVHQLANALVSTRPNAEPLAQP
jgi:hypothetical protein